MNLFDAAKDGNVDELESLIKTGGYDLQQRDNDGRTILHIAAEHGQAEFIKALDKHFLPRDFNNKVDHRGNTAATLAVLFDQLDALSALHDIGVDLSAPDQSGLTAATHAAFNNKVEIIRLLHRKGVDLSAKDNFHPGKAPIHWAAEYGNVDIIHALHDLSIPLDPPVGLYDMTPLCLAAEFKRFDAAKALLSYGVDVNKYGEHNRTPLVHAAIGGSVDIIKLLLDAGADTSMLDTSQQSALHHAASNRHTLCVEHLLKLAVFDINARDHMDLTPLHLALIHGCDISLVQLLFEYKADVNPKNIYGSTPLQCAILGKAQIEVIELLLKKGADVNKCQTNRSGEYSSAITPAIEGRHFQIIPFLYRKGASIEKLSDNKVLTLFETAEELLNKQHEAPPLELMRLLLKLWPVLPHHKNEKIDPSLFPYRLKIQQQLADEQTSLKLIDQSLRHDPHSFFGYLPKELIEYVIKPMVEDFSVGSDKTLSLETSDHSSSYDKDGVQRQNSDIPRLECEAMNEDDLHVTSPSFGN